MRIQTILVPTDFSESSSEAVDFAFYLSRQMKMNMIFLYVDEWPDPSDATAPLHNEYGMYKKDEGHVFLNDLVQRAQDEGLKASKELVDGVPFLEIIRMARKRKVDLVVMGTHGRTGLSQTMIGSESERVVRQTPCPVITVKSTNHQFMPV